MSLPCAHAASFCMSLRGAKRRGNPHSLRQDMAKGNTLGEYERCCGFAQSIANLLAFPAGTRIAAPVCALVRNDKFGRYARARAVVQCTTSQPGDADCHTSAIQATHPSPRLFRRKSQVLSLSAASPSPGRTGAARFHFALVRNDMQKKGRVRGCKDVPPLSLRGAQRRGNPYSLRQGITK